MFQVTLDQKVLVTALTAIGGSFGIRSTLPILMNVKLEAKESGLYLSGTNLESFSVYRIPGDVASMSPGAITVSYGELVDLVKPLKGWILTLSQVGDTNTLGIEAEGFSVALSGIDASEFPAVPTVQKEEVRIPLQVVTLPVETLKRMVRLVQYAASDDLSRPVFTAICVSLQGHILEMAAADAFRLSIARESIASSGSWPFSLLIPAKELSNIVKKMPKQGVVTISTVSSVHTTLSCGDMSAYIRLVEGNFPNYKMIVPQHTELTAVIDVPVFKMAMKSVEKIVKDASNITTLHLNGALEVKAIRDGMDKPMSVNVPSENTGNVQELDIKLNWQYINQVLNVNPGKQVQMSFQAPTKVAIPFGDKKERLVAKPAKITFPSVPGFTAVLMPMNVDR